MLQGCGGDLLPIDWLHAKDRKPFYSGRRFLTVLNHCQLFSILRSLFVSSGSGYFWMKSASLLLFDVIPYYPRKAPASQQLGNKLNWKNKKSDSSKYIDGEITSHMRGQKLSCRLNNSLSRFIPRQPALRRERLRATSALSCAGRLSLCECQKRKRRKKRIFFLSKPI